MSRRRVISFKAQPHLLDVGICDLTSPSGPNASAQPDRFAYLADAEFDQADYVEDGSLSVPGQKHPGLDDLLYRCVVTPVEEEPGYLAHSAYSGW